MNYNVRAVEQKWQNYWKEHPVRTLPASSDKKKFYCLDMFPYPSGSGLHVGHWRGYVLSDVYARMKWLQGYNVLHPMGWDAFGLPAENYALKHGEHPRVSSEKNIANFKRQLQDIAAIYDWSKEVNTTDRDYYKWTQWIFVKMYEAGLAYEDEIAINWCPVLKTGIANEEVVNGCCLRSGAKVEKRKVRQWMLRITNYAEKLLEGLDRLDWPDKVKAMQRNWIGKSVGAEITFDVQAPDGSIVPLTVFTTRPDTLFGAVCLIMAPDHELSTKLVSPEHKDAVRAYQCQALKKLDHEQHEYDKTGIFTGCYAINPVNQERIPLYLSDYVLSTYGTGVIMSVPAHDERDYEFVQAFNLPIRTVIQNPAGDQEGAYSGTGLMINSGGFDGMDSKEAGQRIIDLLEKQGRAQRKTVYRLRDWVFSRQRYWGEPIPLVHCPKCGTVPVPEDQLPVELPDVEKYEPTGTGESPLAAIEEWVNTPCPKCGAAAKRETNTMPQWAGSCWYFLRYPNPELKDVPFSQEDMQYWMPVDLYVGGIEHAILHLLYARFYIKVLHDLGYLPFDEPFKRLFNQGMITKYSEKSGLVEKMSKSKGNVVNPDDMVQKYGSDALRMYMLFMGPPELDCEWQDSGLEGVKRFLNRFWAYMSNEKNHVSEGQSEELIVKKSVHRLLKDIADRLENFKTNTIVSAYMEWLNEAYKHKYVLSKENIEKIIVTFSVVAPHMASELLDLLFSKKLADCVWPNYDPALAMQDTVTVAIQVNGKTRGTISVSVDTDQEHVVEHARKEIAKWLVDKEIVKTIYVKNRMVNFVVK